MKKIKFIFISLAAAITLSCSLEKEPLNGPSTGLFPASGSEAESGLLAAYKNIANLIMQYEPTNIRWTDQLTDIGAIRNVLGEWQNFTKSTITSTSGTIEETYSRYYKGIGRIHLVLDNLGNLKGKITDEEYKIYKAELLCLRAYFYDLLCQFYGDVPFIDHSLSLEDYAYPRTPREDVIKRILADMDDELIEALPVKWGAEWGHCRLGRVGAYALKARICLEWGYYEDAAKYADRALSLGDGIYSLTPLDCTYYADHKAGEPDPSPLFGFKGEKTSQEWIWGAQYDRLAASNVHAGIYTFASRVHNGAASGGPSMAMMDSFQCTDGLSIAESPLYKWTDPWANRDPRLDLYCLRSGARCMGIQFSIDPKDKTVRDYNANADVVNNDVTGNKSEYGPNGKSGPGGYLWRKFADMTYYGSITGNSYEDELDVPIIRFAELLLIDAEANIEMEGGDLERARKQINRVRGRVNMPGVTSTDRATLRTALRYERKVELCCEGFRWFDIRRWKDADGKSVAYKAVNGKQYAPAFERTTSNAKPFIDENWTVTYDGETTFGNEAFNARVHTERVFITGKDELWPFPNSEMTTNPLIGTENNNPGY